METNAVIGVTSLGKCFACGIYKFPNSIQRLDFFISQNCHDVLGRKIVLFKEVTEQLNVAIFSQFELILTELAPTLAASRHDYVKSCL